MPRISGWLSAVMLVGTAAYKDRSKHEPERPAAPSAPATSSTPEASGAALRPPKPKQAQVAACPAGEGPDSIDGACKPLCPDGGPRHAGYCGVIEDCTKSFVNLVGECVLAAPTAKGAEPKTGITFACGASGCVYTLPKGVEGCAEATCQKSCAAPDFRLGKGKAGLLCLE